MPRILWYRRKRDGKKIFSPSIQATCKLKKQFQEKFKVKELTKVFKYIKYGGEEKARISASRQEELWRKIYGSPKALFRTTPLKNNLSSGIPGISLTSGWDKRRNGGKGARYYYARFSYADKTKKTKTKRHRGGGYSVAKHGEIGAVLLAIKARLIGIHGKRKINKLVRNYDNERWETSPNLIKYIGSVLAKKNTEGIFINPKIRQLILR